MKYFIYTRKSTDNEERQVLSIESQLQELKDFAKRECLEVLDVFTESKTAKEPGREVFNTMLKRIEKENVEGILAWHPDRLARNSIDGGKIIYLIDIGKIKELKFPTYRFDNTAYGKFMLSIVFGQSKYYVDNLSENVLRGLRQKLRRGEYPSTAPVGYLNDLRTHTIIVDPEKGPLVRKAFELYASGNHTLESVGVKLRDAGLVGTRGGLPDNRAIELILKNTFYYGVFKYKGEFYEGSHPPLISKALFDKVHAVLASRNKPHNPKKDLFVFRGFIRCGECGCLVTAETKKGHYYYHCTKRKVKCSQRYIREEALAAQINDHIQQLAISDNISEFMLAELQKASNASEASNFSIKQQLKENIGAIDAQLERLLDFYLSEKILQEEYVAKKQKLLTEKVELKEKLEDFGRKGLTRFERVRDFITTCNSASYVALKGNFPLKREFLLKTGSNFILKNLTLYLSWRSPFSFVGETPTNVEWRCSCDKIRIYFKTSMMI
jgi:DNA invertase Pin-like site-specific DNA recombinase